MVNRRLNKPVHKISSYPVAWFREVGTEWHCRNCVKMQKPNTVAFEICVRYAGKGLTKKELGMSYDKAHKLYLCLPCAEKVLGELLDSVKMCNNLGAQAYDMFTRI